MTDFIKIKVIENDDDGDISIGLSSITCNNFENNSKISSNNNPETNIKNLPPKKKTFGNLLKLPKRTSLFSSKVSPKPNNSKPQGPLTPIDQFEGQRELLSRSSHHKDYLFNSNSSSTNSIDSNNFNPVRNNTFNDNGTNYQIHFVLAYYEDEEIDQSLLHFDGTSNTVLQPKFHDTSENSVSDNDVGNTNFFDRLKQWPDSFKNKILSQNTNTRNPTTNQKILTTIDLVQTIKQTRDNFFSHLQFDYGLKLFFVDSSNNQSMSKKLKFCLIHISEEACRNFAVENNILRAVNRETTISIIENFHKSTNRNRIISEYEKSNIFSNAVILYQKSLSLGQHFDRDRFIKRYRKNFDRHNPANLSLYDNTSLSLLQNQRNRMSHSFTNSNPGTTSANISNESKYCTGNSMTLEIPPEQSKRHSNSNTLQNYNNNRFVQNIEEVGVDNQEGTIDNNSQVPLRPDDLISLRSLSSSDSPTDALLIFIKSCWYYYVTSTFYESKFYSSYNNFKSKMSTAMDSIGFCVLGNYNCNPLTSIENNRLTNPKFLRNELEFEIDCQSRIFNAKISKNSFYHQNDLKIYTKFDQKTEISKQMLQDIGLNDRSLFQPFTEGEKSIMVLKILNQCSYSPHINKDADKSKRNGFNFLKMHKPDIFNSAFALHDSDICEITSKDKKVHVSKKIRKDEIISIPFIGKSGPKSTRETLYENVASHSNSNLPYRKLKDYLPITDLGQLLEINFMNRELWILALIGTILFFWNIYTFSIDSSMDDQLQFLSLSVPGRLFDNWFLLFFSLFVIYWLMNFQCKWKIFQEKCAYYFERNGCLGDSTQSKTDKEKIRPQFVLKAQKFSGLTWNSTKLTYVNKSSFAHLFTAKIVGFFVNLVLYFLIGLVFVFSIFVYEEGSDYLNELFTERSSANLVKRSTINMTRFNLDYDDMSYDFGVTIKMNLTETDSIMMDQSNETLTKIKTDGIVGLDDYNTYKSQDYNSSGVTSVEENEFTNTFPTILIQVIILVILNSTISKYILQNLIKIQTGVECYRTVQLENLVIFRRMKYYYLLIDFLPIIYFGVGKIFYESFVSFLRNDDDDRKWKSFLDTSNCANVEIVTYILVVIIFRFMMVPIYHRVKNSRLRTTKKSGPQKKFFRNLPWENDFLLKNENSNESRINKTIEVSCFWSNFYLVVFGSMFVPLMPLIFLFYNLHCCKSKVINWLLFYQKGISDDDHLFLFSRDSCSRDINLLTILIIFISIFTNSTISLLLDQIFFRSNSDQVDLQIKFILFVGLLCLLKVLSIYFRNRQKSELLKIKNRRQQDEIFQEIINNVTELSMDNQKFGDKAEKSEKTLNQFTKNFMSHQSVGTQTEKLHVRDRFQPDAQTTSDTSSRPNTRPSFTGRKKHLKQRSLNQKQENKRQANIDNETFENDQDSNLSVSRLSGEEIFNTVQKKIMGEQMERRLSEKIRPVPSKEALIRNSFSRESTKIIFDVDEPLTGPGTKNDDDNDNNKSTTYIDV